MSEWKTICEVDDIPLNGGRCARVGNHQVAVFRVYEANVQTFYAIDNRDPFSDANVLSRGIVGSLGGRPVVASPVYKQHFCLSTGECLEENVQLRTWRVRARDGQIQLGA